VADRVVFLRPDAERIARAVRTVEAGRRDESPLTFRRVFSDSGGSAIRVCTFVGAWAKGATKKCTIKNSTNEVDVVNLFHNIGADCGERDAAIAKVSGEWILLVPECD
jgi:hypothetical protein